MDDQVEHDIPYFRNLWQINMTDLQSQCKVWEEICMNLSVPDEVHGDIRTNIGLAKLLMNQKLKQFKGLIDDSEFHTGEKEITCLDLQGFWDMVYNEVAKIKKCFIRLEKCKNNGWKSDDKDLENVPLRKVHVKREFTAISEKSDSSKSRALAAKQRLAEAKKKMLALREQQKQQNFVEIAEFNKTGFNHTNLDDNDKFLKTTESAIVPLTKETKENLKQDSFMNGKHSSIKKSVQKDVETVVLNRESNLQNLTPSIQNKENFMPNDDGSNIKYNLKSQTNSKEKTEVASNKKRGKQKEYGKLQCLTRSAKKALLAEQNMNQKS